ncbi:hypothetical protein [Thrips tabaci associated dimarhabdovirus 1]|uniref:Uncharacterized protein n=1 Tax=Thrips tabaci associated dimarhabdovirus 1 TaxID=2767265 RepID=A0A7G9IRA2_9RHAB|nr:hypothetical protein QKU30_gp4 [Thrips tabaci associated dimarhabdovirus 1]QNM37834.1 hypothetical protein [Thrips tabaci associated dimarhabdovirus 1]
MSSFTSSGASLMSQEVLERIQSINKELVSKPTLQEEGDNQSFSVAEVPKPLSEVVKIKEQKPSEITISHKAMMDDNYGSSSDALGMTDDLLESNIASYSSGDIHGDHVVQDEKSHMIISQGWAVEEEPVSIPVTPNESTDLNDCAPENPSGDGVNDDDDSESSDDLSEDDDVIEAEFPPFNRESSVTIELMDSVMVRFADEFASYFSQFCSYHSIPVKLTSKTSEIPDRSYLRRSWVLESLVKIPSVPKKRSIKSNRHPKAEKSDKAERGVSVALSQKQETPISAPVGNGVVIHNPEKKPEVHVATSNVDASENAKSKVGTKSPSHAIASSSGGGNKPIKGSGIHLKVPTYGGKFTKFSDLIISPEKYDHFQNWCAEKQMGTNWGINEQAEIVARYLGLYKLMMSSYDFSSASKA